MGSPSKPVWPPEWTATMEFEHLPTGERTLGVYMYSQEAEYVALVNGNADGLCAGSGFVKENEPASTWPPRTVGGSSILSTKSAVPAAPRTKGVVLSTPTGLPTLTRPTSTLPPTTTSRPTSG